MTKTPLVKYLEKTTQTDLARLIGRHQTGISRMVREKRNIVVVTHDDGTVELREKERVIAAKNST